MTNINQHDIPSLDHSAIGAAMVNPYTTPPVDPRAYFYPLVNGVTKPYISPIPGTQSPYWTGNKYDVSGFVKPHEWIDFLAVTTNMNMLSESVTHPHDELGVGTGIYAVVVKISDYEFIHHMPLDGYFNFSRASTVENYKVLDVLQVVTLDNNSRTMDGKLLSDWFDTKGCRVTIKIGFGLHVTRSHRTGGIRITPRIIKQVIWIKDPDLPHAAQGVLTHNVDISAIGVRAVRKGPRSLRVRPNPAKAVF